MTIEIDLELLKTTNLSADEYIGLYLELRKGYTYLEELNLNIDWNKLESQGYIKDKVITNKFRSLFSNNFDAMFEELLSIYPSKVSSSNGVRVLHAVDPKAKSNLKAKNRYKKVVGNKLHVHNRVIKLLKVQLNVQQDNLGYLQNLETWINNHTWEKYENINENDRRTTTKRITRSL
jgi:hypothetical protein